jgi:hypothetical protein
MRLCFKLLLCPANMFGFGAGGGLISWIPRWMTVMVLRDNARRILVLSSLYFHYATVKESPRSWKKYKGPGPIRIEI